MKRVFAYFMAMVLLCTMVSGCGGTGRSGVSGAPASSAVQSDSFVIHASVPDSWMEIGLWAWSDTKGDLYAQWPGEQMNYDGNGWYSMGVPGWVNYVIINGYYGDVQTGDLPILSQEVWIEVAEDGTAQVSYSAPADSIGRDSLNDSYVVRVQEPSNWLEVNIWAWSDSMGDLYDAWPGGEMSFGPDGWYTMRLPKVYDKVVISGNRGEYQTADIATGARDVWIVIEEDGSHRLYTSEPTRNAYASSSSTSREYDAMFFNALISDVREVSPELSRMAAITYMDEGMVKMEFGYHSAFVEEIAIVYYYDVSAYPDSQLAEMIPIIRDRMAQTYGGPDFITTSDMLYNTWLAVTIHAKDLGDPDNAKQMAALMNLGDEDLSPVGTILLPTAEEAEASGFCVKFD